MGRRGAVLVVGFSGTCVSEFSPAFPPETQETKMSLTVSKVTIPVRDQARALKFYTQALGFELLKDAPYGDGERWIELRLPGQEIEVVLFPSARHPESIGTFQPVLFTAPDIAKAYEELKAKGVEFTMPPQKEPWGIQSIFKDPDGNSFCLAADA
jgi:predicted enzyme related to lactoylglutathione lyase